MRIVRKQEVVETLCPHCGNKESYRCYVVNDEQKRVVEEFGECTSCGLSTYDKVYGSLTPTEPTVKCPYCGSTSTKKISTLSRMGSFATFGFAGKKVGKQWHCNNCKSDF